MKDKIYRLTDDIEFSIHVKETLDFNLENDRHYMKLIYHVGIIVYHGDSTDRMSIYIPMSRMVVKEYKKMRRGQYIGYRPSNEFIHQIRGAIIVVAKRWRDRRVYKIICDNVERKKERNVR